MIHALVLCVYLGAKRRYINTLPFLSRRPTNSVKALKTEVVVSVVVEQVPVMRALLLVVLLLGVGRPARQQSAVSDDDVDEPADTDSAARSSVASRSSVAAQSSVCLLYTSPSPRDS